MKPIYLEFCGINSFSEKTEIDFRALLSGGVFGIFGDTGSGKSTILDCIHLALYGQIERSSGGDFIHYGADSAYVVFDFEIVINGVRRTFKVRRERRRKNNVSKAQLYEYKDGAWLALADGTRDVNEALEKIIGLTFADFKMCIALPQGDFAALVKSTPSERVKLVSRLFDLEKYGERLFKAVSEKFYAAESEVKVLQGQMGQNEGGSDENIAAKEEEIAKTKTALQESASALERAERIYQAARELHKEKRAFDELKAGLAVLQERLPQMETLRLQTERLPMAKSVKRENDALQANRCEYERALKKGTLADENAKRAEVAYKNAQERLNTADYDGNAVKYQVALERVKGAQEDKKAEKDAFEKWQACVEEYKNLGKENPCVDFDGLKAEKERALEGLGSDNSLLDYIKRNAKDVLLVDAYGEFRADLRDLAQKHAAAEKDIAPLLEKYTLTASGKTLDVGLLNAEFKAMEQKRKLLQEEIRKLDVQKSAYEISETRRKALAEDGGRYHQQYNALCEKNKEVRALGEQAEIEERLRALQAAKKRAQEQVDETQRAWNGYLTEKGAQEALAQRCKEAEKELIAALERAVKESGFASVEDAVALLEKLDERSTETCKVFFERYAVAKSKYEETDQTKFVGFDENAERLALEQKQAIAAAHTEQTKRLAALETELGNLLALRERNRALAAQLQEKQKSMDLCEELRNLLKSNRFLSFIASEYLQEICVSASGQLRKLTGGRYFLHYDEEFKVGDNLDGGNFRAVKTLSGGETFLVSLSLALSLSQAICQKSMRPIEFFFLDEGFGTLDDKLVNVVMDVLGRLSKDFAVGLISHVEELKHRIDNKILVSGATESHGSRLRTERF